VVFPLYDAYAMRTPLAILRDATHLLAPLTANCRRFHDRWEAAAGLRAPGGCWRGEWRSEATGHSGPLRCVVEPTDTGVWRASFHAGYARVFRACYATQLAVTEAGGGWRFKGRSDLGRLAGGVYEYEGEATMSAFRTRYRSRHDHGRFELHRADPDS
jgi:hypothetical protein